MADQPCKRTVCAGASRARRQRVVKRGELKRCDRRKRTAGRGRTKHAAPAPALPAARRFAARWDGAFEAARRAGRRTAPRWRRPHDAAAERLRTRDR